MSICNSGGTIREKRACLSRTRWMNSLSRIWRIRSITLASSCQRLVERSFSQEHHQGRIDYECNQRRGEKAETGAAQKYALQYDDVVARRDQVGERLDADRHLIDWKRESRKQERRQKGGHQANLACGELILRGDRNQESQ